MRVALIMGVLGLTLAACGDSDSPATAELEVTHWWSTGGEVAAMAELAKAFDATGNKWIDTRISEATDGAPVPLIEGRIKAGDPMGATLFYGGPELDGLLAAGAMRDLTALAEREGWKDFVRPASALDKCTVDGKIYCVPVNLHSWEWLWLSNKAFTDAGVAVPKNWDEFVASAPALEKAGKIPLVIGMDPEAPATGHWQASGVFHVLLVAVGGAQLFQSVFGDRDEAVAAGPQMAKVFKAAGEARAMAEKSKVASWNDATELVIKGEAGGQIMGDWAQGEFAVAGQVAGKDYTCLPGLGVNALISTDGDSFYFPLLKDAKQSHAQEVLASTMLSKSTQVAFNLKKGSLPIRGDVDLAAANDCMKKGLALLADGHTLPNRYTLMDGDTVGEIDSLFSEFFADPTITPEAAQARFVAIVAAE